MRRIRFRRPTPAMAVAMVALFVALGGTGYAALQLPPHSVGKKELKRNAVTTTKIDNGTIRLKDFYRRDLRRLRRAAAGGGDADDFEDFEDFEDFDDFEEPDEPDQPAGGGGSDSANGAALLTGAAGGLPDSGDPAERAPLTGLGTADDSATQVATLSPSRELALSDLSVALDNDVPAGASAVVEIVARALADPAETVVLGCTVTGTAGTADRTCTAAGPGTLPPNQLFYVRITVSGGGVSLNRGYWGVSVEP
jgi:hypothetical protein